jgi:hypothetical protein
VLPLVLAAAPPGKDDQPAPVSRDAGMFPRVEVKSEHLAALAIASPFVPRVGAFSAIADLYAGTHPNLMMWSLRGDFSTKAGRINFGARLLFYTGFGPPATTPLMELVVLLAGEQRDFWELIDTDEVRPIPEYLLKHGVIRDRTDMATGVPEYDAYWRILVQAHYTSEKAFAKAARHDLTYFNLFNEPERYRGQVVRVSGRLIRLVGYPAPDEARAAGAADLYEGWIMTDAFGENPVCVAFTDLPPGLTVDNRRKYNDPVTFAGYFYKRYRYKAGDSKKANEFRDAPLLIGHSIGGRFNGPTDGDDDAESWGHNLIWVFVSVVAGTLLGVMGLTFWFRYYDRRIRHRLLASRNREFVPPTAERLGQVNESATNDSRNSGEQSPRPPTIEFGRGSSWSDYPHAPN